MNITDLNSGLIYVVVVVVLTSLLFILVAGLVPSILLRKYVFKTPLPLGKAILLQVPLSLLTLLVYFIVDLTFDPYVTIGLLTVASLLLLTKKQKPHLL